jgi:hypothetical protein
MKIEPKNRHRWNIINFLILKMLVVDIESGCGIISLGNQTLIRADKILTWEGLEANRNEWLNLISLEDFYNAL